MNNTIVLDWSLVAAAIFALLHLASPTIRGTLKRHSTAIGSLGGGMAVTYVFLHLFPELEASESVFGRRIHVLVLVGFLVYYGVEQSLGLRESKPGPEATKRNRFFLDLTLEWVYCWLLLYALPDSLKVEGLKMIPLLIAIGLHQAHGDFELSEENEKDFDGWGRYVLATGPLFGWVTALVLFQENPTVSSVCTAVLAGSCLYRTFRHELPESGDSKFRWFLSGVVVFMLLFYLAG